MRDAEPSVKPPNHWVSIVQFLSSHLGGLAGQKALEMTEMLAVNWLELPKAQGALSQS